MYHLIVTANTHQKTICIYGYTMILTGRQALAKENCILSVNEVDVVAVSDQPGGLADVLQKLSDAQIDIEYMYSLIDRGTSDAYMVFRLSDEAHLLNVLSENGIVTVSGENLGLK